MMIFVASATRAKYVYAYVYKPEAWHINAERGEFCKRVFLKNTVHAEEYDGDLLLWLCSLEARGNYYASKRRV
jgi:hypothetical protein